MTIKDHILSLSCLAVVSILTMNNSMNFAEAEKALAQNVTQTSHSEQAIEFIRSEQVDLIYKTKYLEGAEYANYSMYYRFPNQEHILWLTATSDTGANDFYRILLHHPALKELHTWNKISENGLSLYMRSKDYSDIETFLQETPEKAYIDESVKNFTSSNLDAFNVVSESFSLSDAEYVLTSYTAPSYDEKIKAYPFTYTISTEKVTLNSSQAITWHIHGETITNDNPIEVGGISLHYENGN